MQIGGSVNKRTKALQIPKTVKEIVAERDTVYDYPACVICGQPGFPHCHFVAKSQGGLGIEQNIVTLCDSCHYAYDNTEQRPILRILIQEYLEEKYPDWDETELYYKKGAEI